MTVKVYTAPNCGKCKMLKGMLDHQSIEYSEEGDVLKLIELGFMSAPCLEVNGQMMDYDAAKKWVTGQKKDR